MDNAFFPDSLLEEIKELTEHYPKQGAALIPALHRVQERFGYISDRSIEQLSEVLEIPQGTVYSRISRGMDALRAAVAADSRPGPRASLTPEAER